MVVRSLFPILRTRDLAGLQKFYESVFDAVEHYRFEDVYVALTVGGGNLGIGFEPELASGDRVSIWFYVDDVDAVHGAAVDAGASSVMPPSDMPWGERVAQVRDPDGNLLHLGRASS